MTNKVTIKIVGEKEYDVKQTLDVLLKVFPISIEGKMIKNDRNDWYHCPMTIQPSRIYGVCKQ